MYTAHKWLEKNRGQLKKEMAALLSSSGSLLLKQCAPATPEDSKKPPTVSAVFRGSMRELSATMLRTTQNFIRCVKPNGKKLTMHFSGEFTARQLRYLGVHAVIEVNKVSSCGVIDCLHPQSISITNAPYPKPTSAYCGPATSAGGLPLQAQIPRFCQQVPLHCFRQARAD